MPSTTVSSPIGPIRLDAEDGRLTGVRIGGHDADEIATADPLLLAAADQLRAYFAGERTDFDLLFAAPATPRGGALRAAISSIGFGETSSYGALARAAKSSPRAVGQACARNPFPLIVPCHRITAAGGALGNYSAGNGSATKQWLLEHERGERHGRTD